jgi:hypothetical protein
MKKLATFMLLSIYLLANAGLVLHVHACHEDGTSIGVYEVAEPCCCHANAYMTSCCTDAEVTLRVDQPQQVSVGVSLPLLQSPPLLLPPGAYQDEVDPPTDCARSIWERPPKVARWRWLCAPLLYG